ncbi:MAG: hypothetical protein WKG52_11445 [Variovorax sp.]
MKPQVQTVSTLLCHRDVDMGLRCLKSLADCSHEPVEFAIHDDGSLTADDQARLLDTEASGIAARIILRADADALMDERLAPYPHCAALRKRQAYGLKLFDIPFLSVDPVVRYMDSDVLFMRPACGLLDLGDNEDCVFMQDHQSFYAMRPWHMRGRLKLPQKINSGLFVVRRTLANLESIEWLLAKDLPVFHKLPWFEQTCWAWLSHGHRGYVWDSEQVKVVQPTTEFDESLVAAHFVSPVRSRMNEIAPGAVAGRQPVVVGRQPMKALNPPAFMVEVVKRSIRNRMA